MKEHSDELPAVEIFQRGPLLIKKTLLAEHDYDDDYGHTWSGSHIEIELIQGLQRRALSSLIPSGWILCESSASEESKVPNGFCTEPGDPRKEIHLDAEIHLGEEQTEPLLQQDFSLMLLFHEIGHAWSIDAMTPLQIEDFQEMKRMQIKQELRTERYKDLVFRYVWEEESKAWSHALGIRKDLETEGIDSEPRMTMTEIHTKIHSSLGSYRTSLRKIGITV